MGADADRVADELRAALADRLPSHDWSIEAYVGRTPVDVRGEGDPDVLVELEWRRADPANNTVKLFRHLADGALGADGRVLLVRAFTRYYDLQAGGTSSKRVNAEFVGERIAETFESVDYDSVTVSIDPPKRGGDLSEEWEDAVESAAAEIATLARR